MGITRNGCVSVGMSRFRADERMRSVSRRGDSCGRIQRLPSFLKRRPTPIMQGRSMKKADAALHGHGPESHPASRPRVRDAVRLALGGLVLFLACLIGNEVSAQ